jgi:ribosomal protein L30/L7E
MKSRCAASIDELGRRGVILDEEDVLRLLRLEIDKDGSQSAWARRCGLERASVNAMLAGRIPVSKSVADALGLRRTFTAK